MTVYYIPPYDGKTTVTAFKPVRVLCCIQQPKTEKERERERELTTAKGFRMLVGDPTLRTGTGQQKQLCHRCYTNVQQTPFGGAPCVDGSGMDTAQLPPGGCDGGIRATITFPT